MYDHISFYSTCGSLNWKRIKMLKYIRVYLAFIKFAVFAQNVLYPGSGCLSSGGYKGTCQIIVNCDNGGHRINISDFCGSFQLNFPTYCCPHILERRFAMVRKLKDPQNLRPIAQICEYYYPRVIKAVPVFGGGTRAKVNQFPHMAAIGWTNFEGSIDWRCGGTVILANFVLTAAHCTTNRGVLPDTVRVGDLNLLLEEDYTAPENFRIIEVYTHPQYKTDELYHDIALLKITGDYRKLENLRAACIWSHFDVPEKRLTGMGYGSTAFGGPQSNELFQGILIYQTQGECIRKIPITPDLPRGIARGQLCAHDPNNIMDTCQGDSGGPLQFEDFSSGIPRPTIVGITSFGQNCIGNIPGVYTRVSEYVSWIEAVIKPDFDKWLKGHKNVTEGWSLRYFFD